MKYLTAKQQHFVKVLAQTGNASEAARQAYDVSPENADKMGFNLKNNPKIKEAMRQAFADLNLNPEYILKGFKEMYERNMANSPNTSMRALENIASISDMYPHKNTDVDIGDSHITVSWKE